MCDLVEIPVRRREFCTGVGSFAVVPLGSAEDFEDRMAVLLEVIEKEGDE